ncbi:Hypp4622 [Branchiostoma lanceolatum]|uniref:Hypp4622 protein n=1 Tax=Branchiostoma lanceolatum TaxID=7740 RepID=A0A8K0F251_BRALA|nr:Hypp4622 [Branchiostoma lanceolatum]
MTESMCQSDVLHGFAAYRDRELSDNLLQTDDDLDQLHASRARDADAFCGWIPDPRAPPRRLKDGGGPANKPAPKRLRSTKDRRLSQQNLRASYEFRHYRDIGRYIQQYRRDHSCTVAPRDTNPDFTSDALVALLRRADPQKPYLIPRTRVQDIHGGSLEPPKLGVLRRAVTGTSRDWHSFSGSSISRPVTEEALTSSHSPPQLSQQIPARGPERVVAGTGDAGSTTGCGLQFASQSRPSTGTTESRDSGSSSNSNSKSLPNPGTLTLAFSINGNSNNRQQQRPPSNISNRPAKPQYTSIVRSEPSADSKAADAASVSDMSATGINIMAMDRQDFLEHLENFTWREKLKLLSLQEQRPLGAWFRQRTGQQQAKPVPPDGPREKTPEKNKRRAERNSQRLRCLALDPDDALTDHWKVDRHKKERNAQLNQKSLGVVLFKKSLLPERDVRKRLLFNAKGGGWKTYAASNIKPNPVDAYQIPDDISAMSQGVADARDAKSLTEMVSIKTRREQLKSPGKTTPL